MFMSETKAYPSEAPFKDKLLALPANIKIGWKGLLDTNTPALLRTFVNYWRKKYNNIGPVANVIKLFTAKFL